MKVPISSSQRPTIFAEAGAANPVAVTAPMDLKNHPRPAKNLPSFPIKLRPPRHLAAKLVTRAGISNNLPYISIAATSLLTLRSKAALTFAQSTCALAV